MTCEGNIRRQHWVYFAMCFSSCGQRGTQAAPMGGQCLTARVSPRPASAPRPAAAPPGSAPARTRTGSSG